MNIPIAELLQPVPSAEGGDSPCGRYRREHVDLDAAWMEIRAIAEPGEAAVEMDGERTSAPVDAMDRWLRDSRRWADACGKCVALLRKTKDLEVASYLTAGAVYVDGLQGIVQGLELVRGLCDAYWDGLYPPLEEDDVGFRRNGFAALTGAHCLDGLKRLPLCGANGKSPARLLDFLERTDDSSLDEAKAALSQAKTDEIDASASFAAKAVAEVKALDDFLEAKLGAGEGVDFSELVKLLERIEGILKPFTSAAQTAETEETEDTENDTLPENKGGQTGRPGRINSSSDAQKTLDALIDYYARDPERQAHPNLKLLACARAAIGKPFDVLAELAASIRQMEDQLNKGG